MRLKSAVYKSGTVKVSLISDVTVSESDVEFIKSSFEKELPGIKVEVETHKSIADADIAKRAIISYLQSNCFSVAHAIDDNSVSVITGGKKIKYEIVVLDNVAEYLNRTGVLSCIKSDLERQYSNFFEGEIRVSSKDEEKPVYEDLSVNEEDISDLKVRTVKMCDVQRFSDDEAYDTATYIADGEGILGKCYFAGTVIEKEARQSKKGNTYYRITLDDKSGKISGSYFTTDKAKLQKLEKLDVGSVVIVRGEMEVFNDRPSFLIKGFHFCEFPQGYVPARRPGKKPPEKYTVAFPTPCETTKQEDFFTVGSKLPERLMGKEYVVVDIETTGTDVTSDKITEIGAVRIKNGIIVESFQTLIDPEVALSKKITELTGITDEMLVGQPKIHEAYPDFIKFLGDSVFVAHNADFDYRFLKGAGKELGYYLENEYEDTLIISRKVLPFLPNHKLNTVCAHFNIEFRHHRALSDAFATAEAFIELNKLMK
ncbi:MAG: 3'-5' exoribonuclease [Clostridia bacterium]|nr:3'-5' exoribonuclease [Clostridia bacterium]